MSIPRSEALLQIAAAVADGMPCPTRIVLTHHDVATLHIGSVSAGLAWLEWFGMSKVELDALGGGYHALDSHRVLWWQGRRVTVCSHEQMSKPTESEAARAVRAATYALNGDGRMVMPAEQFDDLVSALDEPGLSPVLAAAANRPRRFFRADATAEVAP